MPPAAFDTELTALSREFAFVCDRDGIVEWADERAGRLTSLHTGRPLSEAVVAQDRPKLQHLIALALREPVTNFELTLQAAEPMTALLWTVPVDTGALIIGNLVPADYQEILEPLQAALGDLALLQRETQRQRMLIERQTEALRVSEGNAEELAQMHAKARQHAEFAADATVRLHALLDARQIADGAVRLLVPTAAPAAAVLLLDEVELPVGSTDSDSSRIADGEANDADLIRFFQEHEAGGVLLGGIVAQQQPVTLDRDDELLAHWGAAARVDGLTNVVIYPIAARERLLGLLLIANQEPALSPATEQRAFAERLAAALENARLHAEVQRANQIQKDLVSIASHELRGPLTTIVGFASRIVRRARGDEVFAPILEELEFINDSATRMTRTIALFLNLARVDNLGLSPDPAEFSVLKLVEDEAAIVRARYDEIDLRVQPAADDPIVESDPDMVGEIVSNLMDNAFKYTGQAPIVVTVNRNETHAEISVSDQGPGIAAADLPRLFERYYRGSDSASKQKGTGLGLYISAEMAKVLGGRIDVQSVVGRGSTFTLVLPL